MRKRLVSILMALCMAVSLLPVQALAADDAYTVGEDTRAKVRLYGGSLVPEENCATLTLADGTVTVFIPTEERLQVVLADTSGKYVGGDLTIYQDVAKPVSYTHLDVYKRQARPAMCRGPRLRSGAPDGFPECSRVF